ncbi:flagellar biosynthesis anti-sigma factor FlgM [Paenibacillus sp. MMS18-CY102]|uniref:flagellar biosynthesis anti-sigma factor FlgM n=1 Tax=Paenibacillus sp. MMS18-CY102 TaxID=2682849 RepID=UPI0013658C96|nr:flagellar biosynthesis anti-sigma factor FlgM [Paenibacillus sp. MMS18-CY102]MWC30922.1 flagellar biosynthesis anti-sigma factor FlgM [Paenibacillus sp. MMS18-CY102]
MKINEPQRLGAVNPYAKHNEQRAAEASRKKKTDNVQISSEAMEMLQSQNVTSPERQKQIEALKEQVSTGTYHVESGKIAEKLLPYLKQQDRN